MKITYKPIITQQPVFKEKTGLKPEQRKENLILPSVKQSRFILGFLGNKTNEANKLTFELSQLGHVPGEQRIPDGFKVLSSVGFLKFNPNGEIERPDLLNNEIIVVNRTKDEHLQWLIKDFKEEIDYQKKYYNPSKLDLLEVTCHYVKGCFSCHDHDPKSDKFKSTAQSMINDVNALPKEELLLGDDIVKKRIGVCRHQALLLKILGDEAGLNIALRSGYKTYKGTDKVIGHLWCESTIEKEPAKQVLIDPLTKNSIIKVNPENPHEELTRYKSLSGIPVYATNDIKKAISAVMNLKPGETIQLGTNDKGELIADSVNKGIVPAVQIEWDEKDKFVLKVEKNNEVRLNKKSKRSGDRINLSQGDIIQINDKTFEFNPFSIQKNFYTNLFDIKSHLKQQENERVQKEGGTPKNMERIDEIYKNTSFLSEKNFQTITGNPNFEYLREIQ